MLNPHSIRIPEQLKDKGLVFVKVKGKKPYERGWQNKEYPDFEMEQHLSKSLDNYGVLCGYNNLIVIDIDDLELAGKLKEKLPPTFTVKTSKGYHFYYFCLYIDKKIILKKESTHYGEILSNGCQAVAPNSIHPETNQAYLPINDNEIAHITYAEIYFFLSEYIELDYPKDKALESGVNFSIEKVLLGYGITLKSNGKELQGEHPIHGSNSGKNFCVNTDKNLYYCFRCHAGGNSIDLIGILEGLKTCNEKLTGEKFIKTAKIIKEKFDIDIMKNNTALANTDKINSIINSIEQISPEISQLEIATKIGPILKELSKIDETQADALLTENIKNHFNLTDKKIEPFSRKLKELRKQNKKEQGNKPSLAHSEILELLKNEQDVTLIHPAIDFMNGILSFGVLIQDELHTVTSEKIIIQAKKGDSDE